jgi:hypothetical protein
VTHARREDHEPGVARCEQVFDTGPVSAVPSLTVPQLKQIADRARPTVLAREQVLPVLPALAGLLPGGSLQRGTTVGVVGEAATSLALALAAGPSAAGSWVAVVGLPTLGLAAAAEAGLALERVVLVREPSPSSWGSVVAALVGAFDVVLLAPAHRVRPPDARRLAARARERGSVLVQIGGRGRSSLECDVRLTAGRVRWQGLARGHGHLQARRVEVEATGRRRAARPRRADLWLFDDEGRVAMAATATQATVTSLPSKRAG